MIFRAIMVLGVAVLLWPQEPDLGFGRPGVLSHLGMAAQDRAQGENPAATIQENLLTRLQQVKADLRAAADPAALARGEAVQADTDASGVSVSEQIVQSMAALSAPAHAE